MPDFTFEHHSMCYSIVYSETKVPSSTPGKFYTVVRHNGNWVCDCKGFKFHGTCSHIKTVSKTACNWTSEYDGPPKTNDEGELVCPKCGSDIHSYRSAT